MRAPKSVFGYLPFAGCLYLAAFIAPVAGQTSSANRSVMGTLDPQTGVFVPLVKPDATEDSDASRLTTNTPTITSGSYKVNFSITIKSTLPNQGGGYYVTCAVNANVTEVSTGRSAIEYALGGPVSVPLASSGGPLTCSVVLPYSWTLSTPTSDTVTLTYTLQTYIYTDSEFGQNFLFPPQRTSTQTFSITKVPANGSTTTIAVTATI